MILRSKILWMITFLAIAFCWPDAAVEGKLFITDTKGKRHTPFDSKKIKASVFVFLLRDCPVSNIYAPELTRIHKEYSKKGIVFFLIHPDKDTDKESANAHAKEYKLSAPVVLDHDHKLTRLAEAKVTPEAAVFNNKGKLVYSGRIDNLYADFGKKRFKPTKRDLRNTLDALLAGKILTKQTTKAVGCYIDFSNDNKKYQK